jgi:hypothetical protein
MALLDASKPCLQGMCLDCQQAAGVLVPRTQFATPALIAHQLGQGNQQQVVLTVWLFAVVCRFMCTGH